MKQLASSVTSLKVAAGWAFFGQAEPHDRVLKRISLHALQSLKQTLRRAVQLQCAYRYFFQALDSLIASHHHPDNT